jgi:hypothetical protein
MITIVLGFAVWLAFSLACAAILFTIGWLDGSFAPEPEPTNDALRMSAAPPEPGLALSEAA